MLVSAVGPDNLAVALDVSLHRIKELQDGIDFSNETAYHIESSLGLSSGFLDQVNPVLTPADIQRINALPSERHPEVPPASVSPTSKQDPTMEQATAKAPAASSKLTTDEDALREVRRANLAVLTDGPAYKSVLARLTGYTPVNISHRLHGNTQLDKATCDKFCDVLGLPPNWFDEPKVAEDIPQAVHALLGAKESPVPASKKSRSRRKATAATPAPAPVAAAAPRAAPAGRAVGAAPSASLASATLQPAASAAPTVTEPRALKQPNKPSSRPAAASREVTSGAQANVGGPEMEVIQAEEELSPIAEALIKTVRVKARLGQLSDQHALRMLTELVTLA